MSILCYREKPKPVKRRFEYPDKKNQLKRDFNEEEKKKMFLWFTFIDYSYFF